MKSLLTNFLNYRFCLDKYFIYCFALAVIGYVAHSFSVGLFFASHDGYMYRYFGEYATLAKNSVYIGFNFSILYIVFYIIEQFGNRVSLYLKYALVLFSSIIFSIEIFLLLAFQGLFRKDFVETFLQTNTQEASEFIAFYLTPNIIGTLVVFVLLTIIFFKYYRYKLYLGRITTQSIFAVFISGIILLFGLITYTNKDPRPIYETSLLARSFEAIKSAVYDTNEYLDQYAVLNKSVDEFIRTNYAEHINTRGGGANLFRQ